MDDVISVLVLVVFLVGVVGLFVSFLNRFQKHRRKLLITGTTLFLIGLIFIDWDIAFESFMRGFEACYNG